ncbi:MAG: hypothetical protein U0930_15835 [Pirellulales bacterium]
MKSSKSLTASLATRWPIRFRLQTIMVLGTALIVLLGLVVNEFRADRLKRQACAEIKRLGGRATMYRSHEGPKHPGVINGWISIFCGEDCFGKVRDVAYSPKSLQELSLIGHMPELGYLSLVEPATSVAELMKIGDWEYLETLSLSGVQISGDELQMLTSLPKLANIFFSNCRLPDNLTSLSSLANLRRLGFSRCNLPPDSWQLLGDQRLIGLRVEGSTLSTRDFEAIRQNRKLRTFSLVDSPVSERVLIELRRANPDCSIRYKINSQIETDFVLPDQHELTKADLSLKYDGNSLSKLTLEFLREAPTLTRLSLVDCQLTDEDLQSLNELKGLESLSLGDHEITEEAIGELIRNLPSLKYLQLKGLQLSSFKFVSPSKSLISLGLDDCIYDQAQFDDSQKLPEILGFSGTCPSSNLLQKILKHQGNLKELWLSRLSLPTGSFESLPTSLESLLLNDLDVNDADIASMVRHLGSNTFVEISECHKLTDASVDDLAKIRKGKLHLILAEDIFSEKSLSQLKQLHEVYVRKPSRTAE